MGEDEGRGWRWVLHEPEWVFQVGGREVDCAVTWACHYGAGHADPGAEDGEDVDVGEVVAFEEASGTMVVRRQACRSVGRASLHNSNQAIQVQAFAEASEAASGVACLAEGACLKAALHGDVLILGSTSQRASVKDRHSARLAVGDRCHWASDVNTQETEALLRRGQNFVAEVGRHLGQTAYMNESPVAMVGT